MIKELLLKKGWAGKTISRPETVERLNPILREHILLNREYDHAIRNHPDHSTREALGESQKIARADAGKLAETIYSSGGVAYTGVELDPDDARLAIGNTDLLGALGEFESAFGKLVEGEKNIEHQMRTRAILGVVLASSDARLALLNELQRDARQQ